MATTRKQYPFDLIEPKWQGYWEANKTFRANDEPAAGPSSSVPRPKFYILDMFPYPSGAGLHVGHPEGYTATDILARYKRMRGFNVLHPMGWDAFGLPAEQYAIETGTHPAQTTAKNIATFKRQIQMLGFSYDWDREVDTTDPDYFKWTQWIFLQLFKKGLAYQQSVPVWWCEGCKAVLANEEVKDGKCDRKGHTNVVRRPMRQWLLKITAYADRLLEDLKLVDWTESIKEMQRNWIGRSEGAEVKFQISNSESQITVFTTRPDTLFGATYMVLAPEHPLVEKVTTDAQRVAVNAYREAASKKSELDRTDLAKEKTGVFTGAFAVNPVNDEKIPIWIADYVMISYGTGAIMAVPAHDERDFEFAKKFGLPIRYVVAAREMSDQEELRQGEPAKVTHLVQNATEVVGYWTDGEAFTGDGVAFNSPTIDFLPTPEAKRKITAWLEKRGLGKKAINYKLRDWLFSRQRYWGEPIPVVHCAKCGVVPLPETALPLTLPEMKDYTPPASGEPPLAKATEWLKAACPACGGPAMRETNTMPQWAGSCWYYLRFIDPKNPQAFVAKEKEKYWMPVDLYVGGAEHAVLHLLYARFWHKVLYDAGVVSTPEPFQRLVNQGMILGEVEYTAFCNEAGEPVSAEFAGDDHRDTRTQARLIAERIEEEFVEKRGDGFVLKGDPAVRVTARAFKMSKSRGNVINPDDVVRDYGADTLRLYEMFMGPLEQVKPWSMKGVEGVHRFLNRVWRLFVDDRADALLPEIVAAEPTRDQLRWLHRTIKAVTADLDDLRFNTAISAMMEFVNECQRWSQRPRAVLETFVLLLSPFAPHLAEELWQRLGHAETLAYEPWPRHDPACLVADTLEIPVQVNGKLRGKVTVPAGAAQDAILAAAQADAAIAAHLAGKTLRKQIYVPGRLLNLVVG